MKTSLNDFANTFLLDTGSDICIIKNRFVKNSKNIQNDFTFKLSGIGDGIISTIGCIPTTLFLKEFDLTHDFHVVDDSFPIPCDGIIGYDFVKQNNCNMDYYWNDPSYLIIRPDLFNTFAYLEIFDSPKPNAITLPARAEVLRKIKINFPEDDFLVPTQEIAKGIFIANMIVSKKNSLVKILNTTNRNVLLENVNIKVESLKSYHVVEFNPTQTNCDRQEIILTELLKNCPLQYREHLRKLCREYTDVFALDTDSVTYNNFYKQKLRLKDNSPVYIKNYRVPHTHKSEIENQIHKMLKDDIIEPSASEYNSPVLLVPKKSLPGSSEKRWRLVIDFRQVNKKLLADKFPLPRIDDILDQLGRAKFFSCLDLISGFHQIELDENSRDITSFSTSEGSYRFKRLPYGLKIAPNSFQRMMSIAFSGLSPNKAFVYMDDLIVIGCSEKHMLANLKTIFEICRATNLKLHPQKCSFFNAEVTFLGHKCTDKGILPDDSKFEKILNYPKPTNADEVRRFVAFVNYYRRFIKNFSFYSMHLTRLTRKNTPFVWTEKCETAFTYLKNSLLSPKILKYPDFSKPFCITTDASKLACGAVLSQEYDGIQLPVAFASRSFTKGESNKSVIEQELTAIHWAINFFKPYIYGIKFLVKSDHKPLTYLFSMKNPSSKLTRMRLDLEEFDFEVEYIKGKDNCGADALSRIDFGQIKQIGIDNAKLFRVKTRSQTAPTPIPKQSENIIPVNEPKVYETITQHCLKKMYRLEFSKSLHEIYIYKGKQKLLKMDTNEFIINGKIVLERFFPQLEKLVGNNGIWNLKISIDSALFKYTSVENFKQKGNELCNKLKIALTPKLTIINDLNKRKLILDKFHNDPIHGGHCGVRRLLNKIRRMYTWKGMSKDIKNYVKNCTSCKVNKPSKNHIEPLFQTLTPEKAFDRVQIDTIGPLPKTISGNEYAVTIMCELTKYLITAAVPNKSAKTVAKAIVENCILVFGPVKEILTDMGTEYRNQIFLELCQLLKIEHRTATPYHHQTLGMVERSHKTFNEYMRAYLNPERSDWDEWLKFFTYCYNTTPSSVHNYAPFELVYGKSPTPLEFLSTGKTDPVYNFESYKNELRFRLQEAQKRASSLIDKAKLISKFYYDKNSKTQTIKLNDKVFLKDDAGHKLSSIFKGPYQVVELYENGNCKISCGNKTTVVHKNRLKLE